jgi:type IV pilus assembly protein PilA
MKKNNKGFSLIELIIVIAIMAILVAIIAPNLTKYLGKSKKSTDKKNADEIASQLQTSISDYESQDDAGEIIGTINEKLEITWGTAGSTASISSGTAPAAPLGGQSFIDIVNQNITSSTKSKEKASQATTATITKVSGGKYKIEVVVGTASSVK